MRREQLAIVSACLTAICVVPYLRDVYRGTTRPQRASWFVFCSLAVVAAVSQVVEGAGAGALLATGSAIGFTAVFLASIRRGVGGTSRWDVGALALATIGVVLSVLADEPMIALVAVIVAELAAVALTAHKALRQPHTETLATWMIDCVAGVLAIVAVSEVHVDQLLYPVHHALANAAVVLAIALGRRQAGGSTLTVPTGGR